MSILRRGLVAQLRHRPVAVLRRCDSSDSRASSVYIWGSGDGGQLGLGEVKSNLGNFANPITGYYSGTQKACKSIHDINNCLRAIVVLLLRLTLFRLLFVWSDFPIAICHTIIRT